jgi:hypothetical protein
MDEIISQIRIRFIHSPCTPLTFSKYFIQYLNVHIQKLIPEKKKVKEVVKKGRVETIKISEMNSNDRHLESRTDRSIRNYLF